MSALSNLKTSRIRKIQCSREPQESVRIIRKKPGLVSTIRKYFEEHPEDPNTDKPPYLIVPSLNNNILYPSGQTEQTSTWDGPQMAQQSASAGQPIGDAGYGHMT